MERVTYRIRNVGSGRFLHVRRRLVSAGVTVYQLEDDNPSLDDWEAHPPFVTEDILSVFRILFHVNDRGVFPEMPQNPFNTEELQVVRIIYKEEVVC